MTDTAITASAQPVRPPVPPASGSVVLTGPTRGLGRQAAQLLARRHPGPLVLVGRPGERLTRAADRARRAAGSPPADGPTSGLAKVRAIAADLARLGEVRTAARQVARDVALGDLPPVSLVVCSAGVQTVDVLQRSADGHELTFAVNVLANHALLSELRPALAPECHIVLLGSGTHYGDQSFGLIPPPRWEDPAILAQPAPSEDDSSTAAGGRAYATSKLAVMYLAHSWQRELGSTARVNVYDPGLMPGTGLARHRPPLERWAWSVVMPVMRVLPGVTSARRSASHLVDLALGTTHGSAHDAYVALGDVRAPSAESRDRAREDRLWQVCESLSQHS